MLFSLRLGFTPARFRGWAAEAAAEAGNCTAPGSLRSVRGGKTSEPSENLEVEVPTRRSVVSPARDAGLASPVDFLDG
jgi:hypothetical protein